MNESMQPAAARRKRLLEHCPDGLVLVRGAGPDGLNPNFFYLTGLREPAGVLALSASGLRVSTGKDHPGPDYMSGRLAHQVLFLPISDPVAAQWGEDAKATYEGTHEDAIGVDVVLPTSEFSTRLSGWLQGATRLDYVRAAAASIAGSDEDATFVDSIRNRFLNVELRDVTPTVTDHRTVKDASEIDAIERAAAVTATGFERVLGSLRPGIREHQLDAELAAAYRAAGAGYAFGPIVGAGRNALKLHYRDNDGPIETGDLVLVDSGAKLDGYCADVTRTLPADGTFSPRQRELYEIVLAAQTAAIEAIRPGISLGELHAIAWRSIDSAGYGKAFIHGIGHHLGIETHDAGDIHQPLRAAAVITVEPGLYLADEGIGIRIEDDVLVTADGFRELTAGIPKTIEAIEASMARR
jgi:Xaa-Pro aminopeptidase